MDYRGLGHETRPLQIPNRTERRKSISKMIWAARALVCQDLHVCAVVEEERSTICLFDFKCHVSKLISCEVMFWLWRTKRREERREGGKNPNTNDSMAWHQLYSFSSRLRSNSTRLDSAQLGSARFGYVVSIPTLLLFVLNRSNHSHDLKRKHAWLWLLLQLLHCNEIIISFPFPSTKQVASNYGKLLPKSKRKMAATTQTLILVFVVVLVVTRTHARNAKGSCFGKWWRLPAFTWLDMTVIHQWIWIYN